MNKLNKTQSVGAIVVAAVGLALASSNAGAAAVTAGTTEFSKQFTQRSATVGTTLTSTLPVQTVTTVVALQSGDRMTINLGGTAGAQFAVTTNAAGFGALDCAGAANWTFVSGTATQRVFQSDGADAAGACTLTGATITNASLGAAAAGATVTLSATATRDVTTVDSAPAVTVATVVDQFFATVVQGWNGIIDYAASDGRQFTNPAADTIGATTTAAGFPATVAGIAVDDDVGVDTLAVRVFNRSATTLDDATLDTNTGLTITINGDFSALSNTTADGCLLPGTDGGNSITVLRQDGTTVAGSVTSTNCNSITVSLTQAQVAAVVGDANHLMFIRFNNNTGVDTRKDLAVQTFTGSASFSFIVASSAVVQSDAETSFAPGAHSASGSRIFVPYVPVGSTISQVVQLANNSARTGTVTMTARNQAGTECTSANMGGRVAIGANRITDLGSMLAAGIANCYATGSHKLYVVVTADVPDTAIELYTSYNVNGNRVAVVNSSNGRQTNAANVGGGNGSL